MSFFQTTEFYVIATMAAAAVVAACMRPPSRGEAIERLLAGRLCDVADPDLSPHVTLTCDDSGAVLLTRSGLEGLSDECAVSVACTLVGDTLTVKERIVRSNRQSEPVDTALFTLDFLCPGRYHVRYQSEQTGLFAAFPLTVRPGNTITRPLRR